MTHSVATIDGPAHLVLTSIGVYVALIVMLRLSGKRTLAKLNAFDFVVTIALGSVLATTVLSDDVTIGEGVLALGSLVLLQYLVALASSRWAVVDAAVKSRPTAVLIQGQLCEAAMRSNRVRADEVAAALRKRGARTFEDASAVVLETDGTFSVLLREPQQTDGRSTLDGVRGVREDDTDGRPTGCARNGR